MKTAICYDRVNKWGGAERVLLALHEIFPKAPLYTSVYDPDGAPWAEVFPNVIPSFLQRIPGAAGKHEKLAPLMPLAFESFDFSEYELVITVTSEAAKGIITKPATLHVCYCLTPTRYLWSHYEEYFKGQCFRAMTKPFVSYLQSWDKVAAQRPDVYIAISTEVQKRIKKYYCRESEIVFPPVDVDKFKITKKNYQSVASSFPKSNRHPDISSYSTSEIDYIGISGNDKYYLIVSRLVPYKKVDLAVKAFNEMGLALVIVGTGSEEGKLRKMAKGNIKFAGFVKDEELPGYYRNAIALIYPHEEDFGITAVESQAAGVPVIAYRAGGALDTVIDGKTGLFFKEQTKDSLINAVKQFDKLIYQKINSKDCVTNAQRFSKERFKKEFMDLISRKD